jgi:alpha,alpha-trehalose-phosphate synthase [UDP-forming]
MTASSTHGSKADAGPTGELSNHSGRLVVVSNRAPVRMVREGARERIEPTVGGVGTTFFHLLEQRGGVWIAWPGGKTGRTRLPMPADDPRFALAFVDLSERDIANYYYGMCNRGLWPLMHYMVPNCHFDRVQWTYYERVNRLFAEAALAETSADDVLWVQDFHFGLVPGLVREQQPGMPIGLFWHVPFPPEQLFRIFPWRSQFLSGMLGSDLIGFHTRAYVNHFLTCCERILGLPVNRTRGEVLLGSRTVRVGSFPLGIDVKHFALVASSLKAQVRAQRIRRGLGSPFIVLGVDRLDYTKGVLERLLGFERFLEANPVYQKRVTLVLIAVPSRTKVAEYVALKRQLDELVGRIVGRFSTDGWVPIRYLHTQFGDSELVAYYRAADVALITPLRDGMNLVAKEYVASRLNDDGVLVLSEFAGAAEELTEALSVNPYDLDEIAIRIKQAIEMPAAERAERMKALRAKVSRNSLEHWSQSFLGALAPGMAAAPPAEETAAASA